jgi:hypothetical protein
MGRADPPSSAPTPSRPRRSPSPPGSAAASPPDSPTDRSRSQDRDRGQDRGQDRHPTSPPTPARSSSPPPRPEVSPMGGLRSSFHPVTPGAFLHGLRLKGLPPGHPDLPGLEGIQHHLHPHLPPLGLPGHPHGPLGHFPGPHPAGVIPPGMNPLMLGPHRDMLPFYPWLMSRHGAYLHRFAGKMQF